MTLFCQGALQLYMIYFLNASRKPIAGLYFFVAQYIC